MKFTKTFKRWYKKTLQRYRDFYYDTHEPYKNRKERLIIEKIRQKRHKS